MKDIPSIKFNHKAFPQSGLEVITLESLAKRKDTFEHSPEKPHQINFYMLIFYTNGLSKQLVDYEWYNVKKNTLIYLSKEQVNAFRFNKDLAGYCMLFSKEYFEKRFNFLTNETVFRLFTPYLFSPTLQIPANSDFQNYFELLYKEYSRIEQFNQESIIDALFTVILTKAEQFKQIQTSKLNDSSKTKLFLRFYNLLSEKFINSRSAEFYAKELAVTYKHLNSVCKELLNKTAKKFIDDYIILEAKRRLINSELKSTELAYFLGFEDPTNFIKYFKKITGLTPNSFKKLHN
jgi:AraC-like DNA-binding protein